MRPNFFTVASTSRWTSSGLVTSAICNAALSPIMPTVFSASLREVFAFTITEAPPAASERAMARPMLRAPPVTKATLPASSSPALIPTLLANGVPLSTDFRQPGCERRNINDQEDQQHHAGNERQSREVDVAHAGAR